MTAIVVGIIFALLPAVAPADIIEWQDGDGVHHYTNLKDEVPKDQRESAQIVVDELARRPAATDVSNAPLPAAPPPAAEPRREAEVVYDRGQLSRAYLEGVERGLEISRAVAGGGGGGGVQINGPLAVANAARSPYYDYPAPYYYPFLTTSFDRGRSRHLTLRMLLEDQFAIDRAAPFVFEERLIPPFGYPPLGVDLNPFLPRGLPHGFPRSARVINY